MAKKSVKKSKQEDKCCNDSECCSTKYYGCSTCGCGGAIYGLGFIGALVYYISNATGFWIGVLGFLKALVWPAFLVNGALRFLGM